VLIMTENAVVPEPQSEGILERRSVIWRESIPEQILPHIRRDIIENRWQPGVRLPEPKLCQEFGISRTPLRQALRALEAEGLIKLVPNVGAVVTKPDADDVREHMEALSALEQWAAGRLAERRPPDALKRIVSLLAAMQYAAKAEEPSEYYQRNDDFHREIVLGAGNKAIAHMHEKLMLHVCRARNLANAGEPFRRDAAKNHEPIVNAILAGEALQASLEMKKHIDTVTRTILMTTGTQEWNGPAT
jgi:DNA-binding GntR family transcriptional regulator